jgi:hypothetical protein
MHCTQFGPTRQQVTYCAGKAYLLMHCPPGSAVLCHVCWCPAGRIKYPSGESYVGQWQQGQRHGQGKWTSAPKALPSKPAAASKTALAAVNLRKAGRNSGVAGSSSKEPRETYLGGWVAGRREGHGVAEYADGGR